MSRKDRRDAKSSAQRPVAQSQHWDWDKRYLSGPFDFIGDVHGCFGELLALLDRLGYQVAPFDPKGEDPITARHPQGRLLHFVGDLVDRRPNSKNVLRLAMGMQAAGTALCVMGNHDDRFMRWLKGNEVQIAFGLETSIAEMRASSPAFNQAVMAYLKSISYYHALDGGALVVTHAGLRSDMLGATGQAVRAYCCYGPVHRETGKRIHWAPQWTGPFKVIYGHTPIDQAAWLNDTLNLDTGCVFGGALTALRWPEDVLVSQPSSFDFYADAGDGL